MPSKPEPTRRPVELFYSYSSVDEDLRRKLETHLAGLVRTGVITTWQFRKLLPGCEPDPEIMRHLNQADIILFLVSADFLKSDYYQTIEVPRAMERRKAGEADIIPVVLRPCRWEKMPFGKLQALPEGKKPVVSWPNEDEAFLSIVMGIEQVARARLDRKSKPATGMPARAPVWNVPFKRNLYFTGREAMLEQLDRLMLSDGRAAVTAVRGMGGIGKTELVLEYCHRHQADFGLIWWIRAEQSATLAGDYAALGLRLGIKRKDQEVLVALTRQWLGANSGWLLVFDNVANPEEFEPYLPESGKGRVILTSRHPDWGKNIEPLKVDDMTPEEAIEFLSRRTGQKDAGSARRVVEQLGYLPLALELAAAYVLETGQSLADYSARLARDLPKALRGLRQKKPQPGYGANVLTTCYIQAFKRVWDESAQGWRLLGICAFLAPEEAGLAVLARAFEDTTRLDEAVAVLRRYSLVEAAAGVLKMHCLVQEVERDWMDKIARKRLIGIALTMVDAAFPQNSSNTATWPDCIRLLPHAVAVLDRAEQADIRTRPMARLASHLGLYLQVRAVYDDAERWLELTFKTRKKVQGRHHLDTATALNNLASLYKATNRLGEAEPMYKRALAILLKFTRTTGHRHPHLQTAVSNYAGLLQAMGRSDDEVQKALTELGVR